MRCLIISLIITQLIHLCHCDKALPRKSNDNKNVINLLLQSVVNAIAGNVTAGPSLLANTASDNETELAFDRRETGSQNGTNWDAISKFLWKPIVAPLDLTARPTTTTIALIPRTTPTTSTSRPTTTTTTKKVVTEWMPTLPPNDDEDMDSITLSNWFVEQDRTSTDLTTSTESEFGPAFHFTITLPTLKIVTTTPKPSTTTTTTTTTTTSTTTTTTPKPKTTVTSTTPTTTTIEEVFHNNRKFPYNPYYPYNPYPNPPTVPPPGPPSEPYTNPTPYANAIPNSRSTTRTVPKDFITISIPMLPVIKATIMASNANLDNSGTTSKWNLITIDSPVKGSATTTETTTPKTQYKEGKITPEPIFAPSIISSTTGSSTLADDISTFTKNIRYKRAVPTVAKDYRPVAIDLPDLDIIIQDDQDFDENQDVEITTTIRSKRSKNTKSNTRKSEILTTMDDQDELDELSTIAKPKRRMVTQEVETTSPVTDIEATLREDDESEQADVAEMPSTGKSKRTTEHQQDHTSKPKKVMRKTIRTTMAASYDEDDQVDYEQMPIHTKAEIIGPVMGYTKYPINEKIFDYYDDYEDYYDLNKPMKMNRELVNGHYGRPTAPTTQDSSTTTSTTEKPRTSWPSLPTWPTLPPLITMKRPDMTYTMPSIWMETKPLPKLPRWLAQLFESFVPKTTPDTQTVSSLYEGSGDNYDDELANFKIEYTAPATIVYTDPPRYTRMRTSTIRPVHSRKTTAAYLESDDRTQTKSGVRHRTSATMAPGEKEGGQVGTNSGQSVTGMGLTNGQPGIVIGNNSGNGKRPARRPRPNNNFSN